MTLPDVLASPLLQRVLGSSDSQFLIEEIDQAMNDPGEPPFTIPLHRHRTEDEAWYVISGTLGLKFGDREFEAGPGSGVLLPHGIPHTFWNAGPGNARYLLIYGPKTAGLVKALHGPDRPDRDSRRATYDRFDADLLE